jgi:nicotinamidase-related amidase
VLKPKHSGFQHTLDVLLSHLGCETLILTGVAGNFCVLFTAHDTYCAISTWSCRATASLRLPKPTTATRSGTWPR